MAARADAGNVFLGGSYFDYGPSAIFTTVTAPFRSMAP